MDMGIVNAGNLQVYDDIPKNIVAVIEEVIFNKSEDGKHVERMIAYAENRKISTSKSGVKEKSVEEWRGLPVVERLKHALVKVSN